jgi:fucose permease
MLLLQLTVITGLLATGMGVALLGSVKLPLAGRLQIDEARVGGLVSMFGFTMIPVILSVGFATDLVGKQPVVMGGSLLMAVSLVALASARRYWAALVGVLLLSASWAALINVVNPLSIFAFPGADPSEPNEAYALNMACFYFGLGAFLTPLAVAFLLKRAGLSRGLLVLAGLVLVTAFLAIGVDFQALAPSAAQEEAAAGAAPGMGLLLRDPIMWLCALGLLFYSPLEASMAAWTTTYLNDKGVREAVAAGFLSAFWLTFTVSRLATALLVEAFELPAGGDTLLILAFALASVAVLAGVVWGRGRGMAVAMVVAAGLIFGPVFPTIMAVLLGHFDKSLHGRAVGLFFAIGGIGWTTIPMMMGAYARRTSVQRGFVIAVGAAAGLVATAAVLHLVAAA